jgi:hypothetical protein
VEPDCINKVGGWAKDLTDWLWPEVTRDDSPFATLNARVLKEVQFPCVALARYPFGLVAVDCNDCATYQVNDPTIRVYVKLQYDPRFAYAIKATYPLTYVPQSPQAFTAELSRYRLSYRMGPKTAVAWGRFIAVSLDRFHVAHAMRSLGIPGGCYVISKEGYEDHALDPVKPRERMPFAEYLENMSRAQAIIDACGFGDLTHRTIESLGVGVPLIRPKLVNQTYDPLIAGVHYLDCGRRGENLPNCLAVIGNDRMRSALIANGKDWFERNCTADAVRRLLREILAEERLSPA